MKTLVKQDDRTDVTNMNKPESSRYLESVQGTIIGDIYSTGQLFLDGRPQGPRFNGSTDAEIKEQALRYIESLKERLGDEYKRLYPQGMELRIWE